MKTPAGELLCGAVAGMLLLLAYLFFRWFARTPEEGSPLNASPSSPEDRGD